MKRTRLFLIILLCYVHVNAQEIDSIKNIGYQIQGNMSIGTYEFDNDQYNEIVQILSLDVFDYYNLEKQYDTDLKKKVFKESSDYKSLFNELQLKKNNLLSKPSYLDFKPSFADRTSDIKYDIKNKTFTITNILSRGMYKKDYKYIQLDDLLIRVCL
jgi:hypothetical protein